MEQQIIENCKVVVSLLDLHPQSSESDRSTSSSSTLNQTIIDLITKFKEKLNSPLDIPFSHKMNLLYQIRKDEHTELSSSFNNCSNCYDVLVIHDRNLIVFVSGNSLYLFRLDSKQFIKTIKLLTSPEPHEMELDGNDLYFSSASRCFKYDLNLLLKGDLNGAVDQKALLWSSPESILSNSWGLALLEMNLKKYVFVMDYGSGIHVFDSETGQQVQMNLPQIRTGCGIAFTPEKEMIISTSNKSVGPVQIYTYNQTSNSWILSRQAKQDPIFNTPYGICYEKRTGLIYLMDTFAYFVFVFRSQDMELVQKLKIGGDLSNKTVYGIYLDSKRGELYLPICDYGVAILN